MLFDFFSYDDLPRDADIHGIEVRLRARSGNSSVADLLCYPEDMRVILGGHESANYGRLGSEYSTSWSTQSKEKREIERDEENVYIYIYIYM